MLGRKNMAKMNELSHSLQQIQIGDSKYISAKMFRVILQNCLALQNAARSHFIGQLPLLAIGPKLMI